MGNSKEKELAKNTAVITFGKLCTQLVSFLLLPLYTAVLNKEEYGTVDLVITYSTLLLPFVTLALEQGLFRYLIDVREDKKKTSQYISTTVVISCSILIAVLSAVIVIFAITTNVIFLFFGLVLIGSVVSAITLQICRGIGDNFGYTVGSTISAIIHVIANVFFIVVIPLGPYGMMLSSFLGNLSCGIFVFYRCKLWRVIKISYFSKEDLKLLSKYSLPLIPNQLSWWALNASDRVIVQLFIGIAGNGLVAIATKFSGVYIQFSNIFNISWTESAALHINDDDAQEFFTRTINSVFKLFLCACCGIISVMPFLFPVMINSQFDEAYGLVPIFMLASLFNVVVSLYGVIYVAHKKSVEIAKTAIYAALLNIISHLVLVNFIGIYAAAVSTAIGYGIMSIYRYFHSRRFLTVKISPSTLCISLALVIVSLFGYYSENKIIQIIVLSLMVVISVLLNKKLLSALFKTVYNRIHR